jgi:septal ring factor EnvC (AmiA/AmiB activator)
VRWLQAASTRDGNQAGQWQTECANLEEARDRALAKADNTAAALHRLTESHEKMHSKVLQLASERDHLRLQLEEQQVRPLSKNETTDTTFEYHLYLPAVPIAGDLPHFLV